MALAPEPSTVEFCLLTLFFYPPDL